MSIIIINPQSRFPIIRIRPRGPDHVKPDFGQSGRWPRTITSWTDQGHGSVPPCLNNIALDKKCPSNSESNNQPHPHDSELMSLHTYLTGYGTMSHWTRSVLLLPPVHPLITQSRHLDPSSMDQVVRPCPRLDHTWPSLDKHTRPHTCGPCHLVLALVVTPTIVDDRKWHGRCFSMVELRFWEYFRSP